MRPHLLRISLFSLIIVFALTSALPNILPTKILDELPSWYSQNTLALGLDLKGGSHLLLKFDEEKLLFSKNNSLAEEITERLNKEGLYVNSQPTDAGVIFTPKQNTEIRYLKERIKDYVKTSSQLSNNYSLTSEQDSIVLEAKASYQEALAKDTQQRSLEVVRRRLNDTGMVEPLIAAQGKNTIVVQLPGVQDPGRIKTLLGSTAKMDFYWAAKTSKVQTMVLKDSQGTPYQLEKRAAMSGEHISHAQLAFNPNTNEPVVNFELDNKGARIFAQMTKENIGRPLAIVLDDQVITAPVIRSAIAGGQGEISGGFTSEKAHDLALLLRAGALPVPLEVVEERTVGPDLGSDAISMGLKTGLFGAASVLLLILGIYGRWGIISCLGLMINAGLIFGALSLLGATLTLPGIAGLILSIGMAVDANILINERIREELKEKKSPLYAIQRGFSQAYSTIVDANITTLIAISLLFLFGSGPIRGFAVTMGIGLLTSMFCAVSINRLIMEYLVRKKGHCFSLSQQNKRDKKSFASKIKFIHFRHLFLAFFILLSVGSSTLITSKNFNLGIDFLGGSLVEVATQDTPIEKLRETFSQTEMVDLSLQEFGDQGHYLIRLPDSTGGTSNNTAVENIKNIVHEVDENASFLRVESVGPSVSGDFAETSILAIFIAGAGMLLYLWWRFESHFAYAAMATVGLDLLLTAGFFSLTGIEFNLTAVATLLALIGYSVNDKVVVFDRIRENLKLTPEASIDTLFDQSIISTLRRTFYTSITTLFSILPMAIAGGIAVESFASPMIFGIVIGTFSTIGVAVPMVYFVGKRREKKGLSQLHELSDSLKEIEQSP